MSRSIMLGLLLLVASGVLADLAPEQIKEAKRATALVLVTASTDPRLPQTGAQRNTSGSAFCIVSSGLFVTNAHVVEGAQSGKITLVLNSGETDQKIVVAKVLRINKERDLAILAADEPLQMPTLELEPSVEELYETLPLVALGYPFGQILALEKQGYPSVSVNTGRITSLRKKEGDLELIQLDAALNPGNSGGPVLNPKGRVVGIVEAGVRATGINFAIPVHRLSPLIEFPEVTLSPVTIPFEKRETEQEFSARLRWFGKPRPDIAVEIAFTIAEKSRTFTAKLENDSYRFKAVPVPNEVERPLVHFVARFPSGGVRGALEDKILTIDAEKIRLFQVRQIDGGDKPGISLISGRRIEKLPEGLDSVTADLGGYPVKIDLTKALAVTIDQVGNTVASIGYRITVKSEGKLLTSVDGTLQVAATTRTGNTSAAPASTAEVGTVQQRLVEDKTILKLAGAVEDVIPGAGGKLLILHLRKLRKLAVFDTSARKLIGYLPLPSDDVLVGAGLEKLIVIVRDQNLIQRWDLQTLEKETTVALPAAGGIVGIASGHASTKPMLLVTDFAGRTLDQYTLKIVDITVNGERGLSRDSIVRASADGSAYAWWTAGSSPSGIRLLMLRGSSARGLSLHETGGLELPSYDGSLLFTTGRVFTSALKPIQSEHLAGLQGVPTDHPAYFMGVRFAGDDLSAMKMSKGVARASLFASSDRRLLFSLPLLDELNGEDCNLYANHALSLEKRLHLFVANNLLLTIGRSTDELVLRKFVVADELEKSGVDYLFMDSIPPLTANKGLRYVYTPRPRSKRGGVKIALESGPEGMKLVEGRLVWEVPAHFSDNAASVILLIGDASGQEIYQSFVVEVRGMSQ